MVFLDDLLQNVNQVSDIILVNPQKDLGISAQKTADPKFVFNYKGEEVITLQSDVTDHFVENNSAIQDQVSLKPEIFTVTGYIGELNNIPPNRALEILKEASERLTPIGVFVPAITAAALRAYDKAAQTYAVAAKAEQAAVSAWATLNNGTFGEPAQTKQAEAYLKFYGWWKQRQLFTVQTPWNIFSDMIIMTLRATQEEDTRMVTNFEITFKQMRFAKTVLVDGSVASGRTADQKKATDNLGTNKSQPADVQLQSIFRDTGRG